MQLSVCVVNHNRTRLALPDGRVLALFPRMLETVVAAARHAKLAPDLVIAETDATRPRFGEWADNAWPWSWRVAELPLPFSLGAGRNLATAALAPGFVAVLDADMLLPPNFFVWLARAHRTDAFFPLYSRFTGPEHGTTAPGAGWGNVVTHTDMLDAVRQRFGQCWPETEAWGGEDTGFANRVRVVGGDFIRCHQVPDLLHQWHPKTTAWHTGA